MASSEAEILRWCIEAFNRGDLDATLEFFDPDIVVHDPVRTGTTLRGHDALRRFFVEWLENWEQYQVEPKEFVEADDAMLVACDQRGVVSGIELQEDLFLVFTLHAGKIVGLTIHAEREQAERSVGLAG
jgi:ketosteroid isomerase-like protein